MTAWNNIPLDAELIERTRFKQDPAACILRSTVEEAAARLRQIPGYRAALGHAQSIAVPEVRQGLRRKLVSPAVCGHLALEIRWDVSLYDHGAYASIRAFLVDSGDVLCVVNARDRSVMGTASFSVEDFVMHFLRAWVSKDTTITDDDALTMNRELQDIFARVYEEYAVPGNPIADAALGKALLAELKPE